MSVAKSNKRVMITLKPQTAQMIQNIIDSSKGIIKTYSKAIEFCILIGYEALANYKEENNEKGENHETID